MNPNKRKPRPIAAVTHFENPWTVRILGGLTAVLLAALSFLFAGCLTEQKTSISAVKQSWLLVVATAEKYDAYLAGVIQRLDLLSVELIGKTPSLVTLEQHRQAMVSVLTSAATACHEANNARDGFAVHWQAVDRLFFLGSQPPPFNRLNCAVLVEDLELWRVPPGNAGDPGFIPSKEDLAELARAREHLAANRAKLAQTSEQLNRNRDAQRQATRGLAQLFSTLENEGIAQNIWHCIKSFVGSK